jgi:hypothetical protein
MISANGKKKKLKRAFHIFLSSETLRNFKQSSFFELLPYAKLLVLQRLPFSRKMEDMVGSFMRKSSFCLLVLLFGRHDFALRSFTEHTRHMVIYIFLQVSS